MGVRLRPRPQRCAGQLCGTQVLELADQPNELTPWSRPLGKVVIFEAISTNMSDVRIDTSRWEREYGKKPRGRRYWRFRIISPSISAKDYEFRTEIPLMFPRARRAAVERARQRGSDQVVVLP